MHDAQIRIVVEHALLRADVDVALLAVDEKLVFVESLDDGLLDEGVEVPESLKLRTKAQKWNVRFSDSGVMMLTMRVSIPRLLSLLPAGTAPASMMTLVGGVYSMRCQRSTLPAKSPARM